MKQIDTEGETMARRIKWSKNSMSIEDRTDRIVGIGEVISDVLQQRGVTISTNWICHLPHSADIDREDWEAICGAGASLRNGEQKRTAHAAASIATTHRIERKQSMIDNNQIA